MCPQIIFRKNRTHSLSLLCRQRRSSFPVGSTATTLKSALCTKTLIYTLQPEKSQSSTESQGHIKKSLANHQVHWKSTGTGNPTEPAVGSVRLPGEGIGLDQTWIRKKLIKHNRIRWRGNLQLGARYLAAKAIPEVIPPPDMGTCHTHEILGTSTLFLLPGLHRGLALGSAAQVLSCPGGNCFVHFWFTLEQSVTFVWI